MRQAVPAMVKEKGAKQLCAMYQDDEFGLEVFRGAEAGLKDAGLQFAEVTTYKRGATDFASQMQKLASAKCDFVVMGTIIRETIGGIATARRLGFNPTFIGSSAAYTDLIHKLGGPAMNGFYATMTVQHPYLDEAAQNIRFWANKYKTKFNEDPTVFSVYGYNALDSYLRAVEKAGANLTTESFIKAMDTMKLPPDMFGSPEMTFSPTKRLGSNISRMSQIQDGRWKVVSDYPKAK
jgi:branched-chain amino acid transport system substrate-binding protein